MATSNIYRIPAGTNVAAIAAAHLLSTSAKTDLPHAVIFLPNRRSVVALRDAFHHATSGEPLLLPRMIPLAELADALPMLFGPSGYHAVQALPAAMPEWHRLCTLAAQVRLFEHKRLGDVTLEQALRLAADLAELQDAFTRAGQPLTMERLQGLMGSDVAEHWQQSLSFLGIVAKTWPLIEHELQMVTGETRQRAAASLLMEQWRIAPPAFPVWVIGSTASQPATADIMRCVAELGQGGVLLSGLDGESWDEVVAGHPYFHLRTFLDHWSLQPKNIPELAQPVPASGLWRTVFGSNAAWRNTPPACDAWQHLHLIPCQHAEEEARVISLLMRENLDDPEHRTALITPDEGLMERVAAHLKRYDITVDRTANGTLASTETGILLCLLLDAIRDPGRTLPLLNLLHHARVAMGEQASWGRWLAAAERYFRGIALHAPGELPNLPAPLDTHPTTSLVATVVRDIAALGRSNRLTPSVWVKKLTGLLGRMVPAAASGQEAIEEALDELVLADALGPVDVDGFMALLSRQLETPWREPVLHAHPNLYMLTPVEARMMQFDRVILANMQAAMWPGTRQPGPWLNYTQQQALGLPAPEERISLMAHDLLMLGSGADVFLTWPQRDGGSPTMRSPFIEKLMAYLELHGIAEETITAVHYRDYANILFAAEAFVPAFPAMPKPPAHQRPRTLRVTALDKLFSDPYAIYARSILGLEPVKEIDAEPESKDLGSVAHSAIQQLSAHWDTKKAPADADELAQIADGALRAFSHRANVQLFWRKRIIHALAFVNREEAARRRHLKRVHSEMVIEQKVALPSGNTLELHGRIDRLEEGQSGINIADYKTGEAPTKGKVEKGEAVQLLAYALMLAERGEPVSGVEYWELPRANNDGAIGVMDGDFVSNLLPPLRTALNELLKESTPFLAHPYDDSKSDYDGISRYEEWAG